MVVYIIEHACPLCGSDVRGNEKYRYYCRKCNVLFEMGHLSKKKRKELPKKEEEAVKKELELAQQGIQLAEKPEEEKVAEAVDYTEDTEPLEEPEAVEEKEAEPEEIKIVASAKSNKMHISTCHFLKKIQKDNWIYLDSLDEGVKRGFIPCVCIRRKGMMKL